VTFVLSSLLNGLSYGMLLFMLSSGLTLIFSMMSILNFAHAAFYMVGAYFAYQLGGAIGFWPALVVAPVLVGVLGGLIERFGLRKVHRFGQVAELLFTFGLNFLAVEAVQLIWGKAAVDYRIPPSLSGALFTLNGTSFPLYKAFMMLVSAGMLAVLYAGLTFTRVGLIVRAALSNPSMAQALGHDVPRIFTLVFAAGTALAGLAGVIGGNALVTDPGMADSMGPIVFVVVVVGGLGSVGGAFAASLLIGVLQTFLVGTRAAQVAPIMPYLLMVAMLIFRPRGLRGVRET
jgi:branched-chain amino acid transport system permease protein